MIYWASPFEENGYVPLGDPRRQAALNRWRAALEGDDASRTRRNAPVPADPPQNHLSVAGAAGTGTMPLGRLLAFGALTWTLGILLAVLGREGDFSPPSIGNIVVLLGSLTILIGAALMVQRVRPAIRHVLVEADVCDPLTGLPNERYLLLRLEEEMAWAHRHERLVTLAVLDVNSLEAINEQYGRDCGDEVLRHVAGVVEVTKRSSDILVRLADDEFGVILPECTAEGGEAFVGRLTERLAREPARTLVRNRASHVWVGVCAGLADMQ